MKRWSPALAVLATSLASCGGFGHASAPPPPSPRQPPAPAASAPGSPPATTPTATSPTGTPRTKTIHFTVPLRRGTPCVASDLRLSFIGQQGGMGHGELGFALANITAKSCHTYGFPGVLFLDKAGHALPTRSARTSRDFFGATPAVPMTIAPGSTVSFRLGVTHGIASDAGCTTAYALQVIAPDDTATLRTAIPDGAYECGIATVSPLRPGATAFP